MHLMKYKVAFFVFSTLLIIPGIIFMLMGGLKLGMDFTGGVLLEYKFANLQTKQSLEKYGVITQSEDSWIIKLPPVTDLELQDLRNRIRSEVGDFEVRREEILGAVIGQELERRALLAVGVATVAIVAYITWAFRKVPKPASSWRFGVAAVVALIHDVLVVLGVFAILGYFWGVEIDALFITAVLTVMGFSVHDTIVVFDRVRENLVKNPGKKFETIVDMSLTQTLARSLNTSLTVVFVLFALILFGGETIRWFAVALLVGIVSGTYSSIFNAAALLTWWEDRLGH